MLKRSRTLTNSAAEWVETRADSSLLNQNEGQNTSAGEPDYEFDPDRDHFVPKGKTSDDLKLDAESLAKIEEFRKVMNRLIEHLKKRRPKGVSVELKKVEDYTFNDVLTIAQQVNEQYSAPSTNFCMRRIQACCKSTAKHKSSLMRLMALAPNDVYSSLISGSLTLIIGTIAAHEDKRKTIEEALAEIPDQMDRIQRLQEIHWEPRTLRQSANSICIAVLTVFEKIIDYQTMGSGQRLVTKVKGRGGDIQEAIREFRLCVSNFKSEVDMCSQVRFGRIEERVMGLETTLATVNKTIRGYTSGEIQTPQQLEEATFRTCLYKFMASHPHFDPRNGTAILSTSIDNGHNRGPPNRAIEQPDVFADRRPEILQAFVETVAPLEPDPQGDTAECLANLDIVSQAERNRIVSSLKSDELTDWQVSSSSHVLVIELETPPEELMNSTTMSVALLKEVLASATNSAVLAFFCGLRTNSADDSGKVAGPLALLNSLNYQLLQFLLLHNQGDVELLEEASHGRKVSSKLRHAFELFSRLLARVPAEEKVFVLIDSWSRIAGDDADTEKFMSRLLEVTTGASRIMVKILVTDPLPSSVCCQRAQLSLYIPDGEAGDGEEPDSSLLQDMTEVAVVTPDRGRADDEMAGSSSGDDY